MIAYLNGKLAHKEPTFVIIEVGGIGYEVKISLNTYSKIGNNEAVKLHTYFMVKEDSHTLFGFSSLAEKNLFIQLISISGVGGNTALTILSSISPQELERAIQMEDLGLLKRVKGIGAKTAGRIILELKGKLKLESDETSGSAMGPLRLESVQALIALGFSKADSEKRVDKIMSEQGDGVTIEQIIKLALRSN
ncbi:MAG: Holliday junction branch migration protein RuvA [Bacteroidia bacterium]|nr:Holliday junction branch migration protein RuvA [Bacteroidia bacterium]